MNNGLKWLGIVAAVFLAVLALGMINEPGRRAAPSQSSDPPRDLLAEVGASAPAQDPLANVGSDTLVQVSRQSSDGVTNSDITVDVAEAIGAYTIERMKFHTQRILDEMGSSDSVEVIRGETVLVPQDGTNYIVTRVYTSGVNNAAWFMRVEGGELTRVLCQTDRADKAVFIKGKCADTIRSEIGLSLP